MDGGEGVEKRAERRGLALGVVSGRGGGMAKVREGREEGEEDEGEEI